MTSDQQKDERTFLIYKYTSPSGKAYIGQTNDLRTRESKHKNTASCRAFHNAIEKYGFENFHREILREGLTLEQANTYEEDMIKIHGTLTPWGYNLRSGGLNKNHSDETKKKMSASHVGKPKGPHSEETRAKIGDAKRGKKKGPRSEETKAKLRAANVGKKLSEEHRAKISATYWKNKGQKTENNLVVIAL